MLSERDEMYLSNEFDFGKGVGNDFHGRGFDAEGDDASFVLDRDQDGMKTGSEGDDHRG